MAQFLVEVYAPGTYRALDGDERAASAGAGWAPEEAGVAQLVVSILVPAEETCFYLFEAATVDDVRRETASRGIACERVQQVVTVPGARGPAIEVDLTAEAARSARRGETAP